MVINIPFRKKYKIPGNDFVQIDFKKIENRKYEDAVPYKNIKIISEDLGVDIFLRGTEGIIDDVVFDGDATMFNSVGCEILEIKNKKSAAANIEIICDNLENQIDILREIRDKLK